MMVMSSDKIGELLVEYMDRWEVSHGPMWVYHIINLGLVGYLYLQVAEMKGVAQAEVEPFAHTLKLLIYSPVVIWYGTPLLGMLLVRVFPSLDCEWNDLLERNPQKEAENAE